MFLATVVKGLDKTAELVPSCQSRNPRIIKTIRLRRKMALEALLNSKTKVR